MIRSFGSKKQDTVGPAQRPLAGPTCFCHPSPDAPTPDVRARTGSRSSTHCANAHRPSKTALNRHRWPSRRAIARFGISRTQRSGREPPTRDVRTRPPSIAPSLTAIVRSTSHHSYRSNVVNSPTTITDTAVCRRPPLAPCLQIPSIGRSFDLPTLPADILNAGAPSRLSFYGRSNQSITTSPTTTSCLLPPQKRERVSATLLIGVSGIHARLGCTSFYSHDPGSLPPPHPIQS